MLQAQAALLHAQGCGFEQLEQSWQLYLLARKLMQPRTMESPHTHLDQFMFTSGIIRLANYVSAQAVMTSQAN